MALNLARAFGLIFFFSASLSPSLCALAAEAGCGNGTFVRIANAEPKFSLAELVEKRALIKAGLYPVTNAETGQKLLMQAIIAMDEQVGVAVRKGRIEFWGTPEGGGERVLIATRGYKYHIDAKSLETENVRVEPPFRRQGINMVTLGSVLEQFPELRSVQGFLADVNATAFRDALKEARQMKLKDPILEAYRAAPGYQSLEAWGFGALDRTQSVYDPMEMDSTKQIFMVVQKSP